MATEASPSHTSVYERLHDLFEETSYVSILKPYEQKLSALEDHDSCEGFEIAFSFASNIGKHSVKRMLRAYFGSPDNEWFASAVEKIEESGFGVINSEFFFPVLESLDECLPLANILITFGVLGIPFQNTSKSATFSSNKTFERDIAMVTSWLVRLCTENVCSKIKPYDRERPVRNYVNVLKSLILREKCVREGSYPYINRMVKDYCGETDEGKNLGLSFVLQSCPREMKNFMRRCLNVVIRELAGRVEFSGNYFIPVTECLNWQFKVTKKGRTEVSTKIKPHTTNSIRYFPNDLRGVKDQVMQDTHTFRGWYEIHKFEDPTEELLSAGNELLNNAYREFYFHRRLFREAFYSYCNRNGKNHSDFEDTYVSSSHFLRTVLPDSSGWYEFTNRITEDTTQVSSEDE